jgi:rRNA maturation RNase YbeY
MATLLDAHLVAPSEVSVAIVTGQEMRRLNATYRGLDEPTDVLAFGRDPDGPAPEWMLGDIAISADDALRQAAARGATLEDEACRLAIHGGLHLLGFDDSTEDRREEMVRRMNAIAVTAGLPEEPAWGGPPHGGPA